MSEPVKVEAFEVGGVLYKSESKARRADVANRLTRVLLPPPEPGTFYVMDWSLRHVSTVVEDILDSPECLEILREYIRR